jgi:copper transport protein
VARRLLLAAAAALAWTPAAWAHAIPLTTVPANGTVLTAAPSAAQVTFDSPVRVAPGNAAIANDDGRSVLTGTPHVVGSRRLVLPLRHGLPHGDYSVRWSIVSEDGHQEQGVIAFAVGADAPPPHAALTVHGYLTWQRILMRAAFFLGVLGAVGLTFFTLVVLRRRDLPRAQAHLLFLAFVLAFFGSDALSHTAGAAGTRFANVMTVAAIASGLGGAAAALAPRMPRLRFVAWAAAAVLFPCPTLAGHALDPDQPRLVAAAADLVHLGGAAVWVGGLAGLLVAGRDAVRRFAGYAVGAVALVAAGGVSRAVTELASVDQLWTTSYGRLLLVKTALFAVALFAAWLRRRPVELVVVAVLLVAVGALTDTRPGRERPPAATRTEAALRSRSPGSSAPRAPRSPGSTARPRTPPARPVRRVASATGAARWQSSRPLRPRRRARTSAGADAGSPAGSPRP